jgi:type IV pilus assembly protein PilW
VTNRTDFSPLASNIVNMQVQYGVDTENPMGTIQSNCKTNPVPGVSTLTAADADAVVDDWVNATGNWANNGATLPALTDLRRIRAVRIGLVARSGVKASGKAGDLCNTVAPVIHWDSGTDMTPDLSAVADWQCYRYKVFQTTIPVRNALWSSTMNPASSASCGTRDPS